MCGTRYFTATEETRSIKPAPFAGRIARPSADFRRSVVNVLINANLHLS